jgi:glycosyltransferase involved in cell wall biosynthesis
MSRKLRLIGLTLGKPLSASSRSGVNYQVFSRLSKRCDIAAMVDLDLRDLAKVYSALRHFSFDRREWGSRLHQNPWAFISRTKKAERILHEFKGKFDIIYQDGAMFMPGTHPKQPFASYHDCNVVLAGGGNAYAHGAHYKGDALVKTIELERKVYKGASVIFTMSEWLKKSLIKDFGIPDKKIVTVYAGSNLQPQCFEKTYDGKTILFVGKNFERKGGPILIEAFKKVKRDIPDSRLVIIGPKLKLNVNGVTVVGEVRDHSVLSRYFKEASVFVLPSRFEPFGIAFVEAFAFQTPCIGTDLCAMPEIIENGKGGYVVPSDDDEILSKKIIEILQNEALARKMGQYGFKKAKEVFNWDCVVDKMMFYLSLLVKT